MAVSVGGPGADQRRYGHHPGEDGGGADGAHDTPGETQGRPGQSGSGVRGQEVDHCHILVTSG